MLDRQTLRDCFGEIETQHRAATAQWQRDFVWIKSYRVASAPADDILKPRTQRSGVLGVTITNMTCEPVERATAHRQEITYVARFTG